MESRVFFTHDLYAYAEAEIKKDFGADWIQKVLFTLPKTNGSPLKMMVSNRNILFQGSIFRGELLVSGRVDLLRFP